MNRRSFLGGIAAAAALPVAVKSGGLLPGAAEAQIPNFPNPNFSNFIKPKALSEGDTVAVIAPGTAVSDPDDLARAAEALAFFKLQAKFGKNLAAGAGYKTRPVAARLDDLHEAFADNSVKAVFCIRGGYGSMRLLDSIDYKLIRSNPKIFVGYSDITAMHLAISRLCGLVTFHGPMMLSAFSDYSISAFRKALFSSEPIGELRNPEGSNGLRKAYPLRTVVPGKAAGRLAGGNLSLVSALMGTPYEIESKGKILFLEDVGEAPYRIDRMLTQLKLAGVLQKAAGIVIGKCAECDANETQASTWDLTLGESLDELLRDLKVPVISGLMFGHTSDQLTIPEGVNATLDADARLLTVTESATEGN